MTAAIASTSPYPTLKDAAMIQLPESWIAAVHSKDPGLGAAVRKALEHAAQLHGTFCVHCDEGQVRALLKCHRGAVVLFRDGRVRSTEDFRPDDVRQIFNLPLDTALASIPLSGWDDGATLFTTAAIDFRLSSRGSWLDGNPETAAMGAEVEVRFMEYFLNRHVLREGLDAERILAPKVAPPDDLPIEVFPHRRLNEEMRQDLLEELQGLRRDEATRAIAAFRDILHQGAVLPVMEASGLNGCRWYNWLVGQADAGSIDGQVGSRRREALSAFPLIHSLLTRHEGVVASAVEKSEKLIPALAAELDVPAAQASKLRGIDVSAVDLPSAPDRPRLNTLVEQLALLPKGTAPRSSSEWASFFSAVPLAGLVGENFDEVDGTRDRLLSTLAGNWHKVSAADLRAAMGAFPDMVNDLLHNLIQPAGRTLAVPGAERWTSRPLARLLVGERSLPALVEVVKAWQNGRQAISAALSASFPLPDGVHTDRMWPPLNDDPVQTSNGLLVECLHSESMLKEEHRRMSHCVDIYTGRCLYQGSHIVSIRQANSQRSLSTAEIDHDWLMGNAGKKKDELDPIYDLLPPGVAQHQGFDNSPPPKEARIALWEYVSRIQSGDVDIDLELIQESLEDRRGSRAAAISSYYDSSRREAIEEAWKAYRSFFPKRVRRKGLSDLMASSA